MRKIESETIEIVKQFLNGERKNKPYWKKQNMMVTYATDMSTRDKVITVYLHYNAIVQVNCRTGDILGTLAGWDTVTTRSRLNAIIYGLDSNSFTRFWRKKGVTLTYIDSERIEADHNTWYIVGNIATA